MSRTDKDTRNVDETKDILRHGQIVMDFMNCEEINLDRKKRFQTWGEVEKATEDFVIFYLNPSIGGHSSYPPNPEIPYIGEEDRFDLYP